VGEKNVGKSTLIEAYVNRVSKDCLNCSPVSATIGIDMRQVTYLKEKPLINQERNNGPSIVSKNTLLKPMHIKQQSKYSPQPKFSHLSKVSTNNIEWATSENPND